jgi:hypothetical protein
MLSNCSAGPAVAMARKKLTDTSEEVERRDWLSAAGWNYFFVIIRVALYSFG